MQKIYGIRPVIEAIEAGKTFEIVMLQKGVSGANFLEMHKLLIKNNIAYKYVPVEKLNRETSKIHQGVVAYTSAIEYQDIEQIIPFVFEKGEIPLILVLDKITDVRNVGGILRTALATGVHAVIYPKLGSAMLNEDAVKSSAGAAFKIPICRVGNMKQTVQFLQESGLQIIACTEKAKEYIHTADLTAPTAIVMGNEEIGISEDILKGADAMLRIPMADAIGSLNVSVATGMVLYESMRQRM